MTDPLIAHARLLLHRPYRLTLWRLWALLALVALLAAGSCALITRYPARDEGQPSIPLRTHPPTPAP